MEDADAERLELAARLRGMGISAPYASQLAKKRREPALGLALKIHAELGLKLGPLAATPDEDIPALARLEANKPRGERAA